MGQADTPDNALCYIDMPFRAAMFPRDNGSRIEFETWGDDAMVFHEPVFVGDDVSCYGELVRTGRTSITGRVEAWRRHLPSDEVGKVTEAVFTHVAVGESRRAAAAPSDNDAVTAAGRRVPPCPSGIAKISKKTLKRLMFFLLSPATQIARA